MHAIHVHVKSVAWKVVLHRVLWWERGMTPERLNVLLMIKIVAILVVVSVDHRFSGFIAEVIYITRDT